MAKKTVDKEIIKKVKLFTEQVKKNGIKIDSVIIFGSQTKRKAKPYSDIDVCVVSSHFGKDEIDEAAKLRLLANKVDWRLEPHLLTPQDLKMRENPFVYEILSTGVKIL